jgi:hypothetical protein
VHHLYFDTTGLAKFGQTTNQVGKLDLTDGAIDGQATQSYLGGWPGAETPTPECGTCVWHLTC